MADKQPASSVWRFFENSTGWPAGVTFLTGLSSPCLMFAGIDSTLHLAEEVTEPERAVPNALLTTIAIAFITGFAYAVGMAYCIQDLSKILKAE